MVYFLIVSNPDLSKLTDKPSGIFGGDTTPHQRYVRRKSKRPVTLKLQIKEKMTAKLNSVDGYS